VIQIPESVAALLALVIPVQERGIRTRHLVKRRRHLVARSADLVNRFGHLVNRSGHLVNRRRTPRETDHEGVLPKNDPVGATNGPPTTIGELASPRSELSGGFNEPISSRNTIRGGACPTTGDGKRTLHPGYRTLEPAQRLLAPTNSGAAIRLPHPFPRSPYPLPRTSHRSSR
jgi:hypothetical protein